MGYFRRLKKSNHTLEDCKRGCAQCLAEMAAEDDPAEIEPLAAEWAQWRELQARHENENQSDTD